MGNPLAGTSEGDLAEVIRLPARRRAARHAGALSLLVALTAALAAAMAISA